MLPKTHAILGLVFSLIILSIFPKIKLTGFFIIWFSSIFIDVDHYLYYSYTRKSWSLKKAYNWFINKSNAFLKMSYEDRIKNARFTPCIFHGIEAIILLSLFSIISPIFLYILIGFIFHQFLDLIHIEFYGFSLNHIGSQTYNILNYKKQKN